MKLPSFSGKRVVITGAAGGIGLSLSKQLSVENASLILIDIDKDGLQGVAEMLRNKYPNAPIFTYHVDITQPDQIQEMVENIVTEIGGVDVLINNAGVGFQGPMDRMTLSQWQRLVNVNFWGTLYMVYAFLPLLKDQGYGQIINVSSGQAFFRLPSWGAYAAIKLMIGALSEIWHFELKRENIHVLTVYPYMVNTGFYDTTDTKGFFNEMYRKLLPYYSNTPDQVAKKIIMAAKKKKRKEMIHVLNHLAKAGQFIEPVYSKYSQLVDHLLNRDTSEESNGLAQKVMDQFALLGMKWTAIRNGKGFTMSERMEGEHQWTDSIKEKKPLRFEIDWGASSIVQFLNPQHTSFLMAEAQGTIDVGGLCKDIPCHGTIHFDYFGSRSIHYSLFFECNGDMYQLTGSKKNIRFSDFVHSHTLCTGQIIRCRKGEVVSDFVIHFFWEDVVPFAKSFRLVDA